MKDWRGNEIREGVTIVYPGRASSDLWMNEGVVTRVIEETEERQRYSHYDFGLARSVFVSYMHEVKKLKVRRTSGKIVTLERVDRVTVVV